MTEEEITINHSKLKTNIDLFVKDPNSFLQELEEVTLKQPQKIIEIISDDENGTNDKQPLSQKRSQFSFSQKSVGSDSKLKTNNSELNVIRSDRRAISKLTKNNKNVTIHMPSENTESDPNKQSHKLSDITSDIVT